MITVETEIEASLEEVWNAWTNPESITQWNFANDEWSCPSAINNLISGGEFVYRMEAKDGSMGFDFTGTYDHIVDKKSICYRMSDGRKVEIKFTQQGSSVKLTEAFEAEGSSSDEQQRLGWQAILGNFKKHVEGKR